MNTAGEHCGWHHGFLPPKIFSEAAVRFGSVCAQKPVRFGSVPVPGWFQKFFTLRAAPQTHPKWPKIVPTWHKNGAKIGVPHRPLAPKMGYPIGPRREKIKKKTKATKKGPDFHRVAPFWSKTWPT